MLAERYQQKINQIKLATYEAGEVVEMMKFLTFGPGAIYATSFSTNHGQRYLINTRFLDKLFTTRDGLWVQTRN